MKKLLFLLTALMLAFVSTNSVLAKGSNSSNRGEDENRVRVEVRGHHANPSDVMNLVHSLGLQGNVNRVRIEVRGDEDRVRFEMDDEMEDEEELGLEVEDNTFEIMGVVTAFTGDSVTIDSHTIIINPSLVTGFEQEGTIEVGETIKVEGMVAADGSLLAREIKA